MDRYAYVLERLQDDDFRRLRKFEEIGRSRFTTWLVVVAGRLCIDFHRKKYGRVSSKQEDRSGARRRRDLVDLIGERLDLTNIPSSSTDSPDMELREKELRTALEASLHELAHEERLLIRLCFEDERPVREVARLMGLSSEFTAHRRLKAVLQKLREGLQRRGVQEARP